MKYVCVTAELSLRGRGRRFPLATMNVAPSCFLRKIEEKEIEPKEIPNCFVHCLINCYIYPQT